MTTSLKPIYYCDEYGDKVTPTDIKWASPPDGVPVRGVLYICNALGDPLISWPYAMPTVANLSASLGSPPTATVDLTWDAVPTNVVYEDFVVEYSTVGSTGPWDEITESPVDHGETGITAAGLIDDEQYWFRVTARWNGTRVENWLGTPSNWVTETTDELPPPFAPTWTNEFPQDDETDSNSLLGAWGIVGDTATYQVYWKSGSTFGDSQNPAADGTELLDEDVLEFDHAIGGHGTVGYYVVRARNSGGDTLYSDVGTATVVAPIPGVPTILTPTWFDPSKDATVPFTPNAPLIATLFRVQAKWKACGGSYQASWQSFGTAGSSPVTTGAIEGMTYKFHVRAEGAGGNSDYSGESSEVDCWITPIPPLWTSTYPKTGTPPYASVDLSWAAPTSGHFNRYDIRHRIQGQGWPGTPQYQNYDGTTLSVGTLLDDKIHEFQVRAVDSLGCVPDGTWSSTGSALLERAPIVLPPDWTTVPRDDESDDNSLEAWWTPAQDSDTTQVMYNIGSDFDPDSAGSELQDSSATNFDHVLSLGQEVFYYIRGRHQGNPPSNGPWTDPVRSATVLERAPGIPSITNTSLNYGAQQITLTWSAGSPDNADVYRIESNRKSCVGNWEGWIAVAPPTDTASPYVHSAIVDGYSYKYKIQAENTHPTPLGYSDEGATVDNYQAPTGPTWVSTFPKPNAANPDSAIDLSWNVPTGTVDTYEIEYKLSASSWTGTPQVTGIGTTTYTISTLNDDTYYDFRVRASSTCTGDGDWGTTGTESTDRSLVEDPPSWTTVPQDDASDDNSLEAWWTPAFESDTTQVMYNIGSDFDPDSAGYELQDSDALTFDHVLSLGQEVFYYIRGRHATSNGPWTTPVRSATVLERAPGIPSITDTILNYGSQQITVSWSAGTPTNADVYRVLYDRKPCGGDWEGWVGVAPPTDPASPYVHTTIVDGYSYKYKVRAENTGGNSNYSTEGDTVDNYQAPSGPTWVSSFPKTNAADPDNAVDLSWNVPAGTVDTYEVEYKLSAASWTGTPQVTGIGDTTYTVSTLIDNTSYDFRVRASSTCTGDGDWGTTGTVVTDRSLVEDPPSWTTVPRDDDSDDNSLEAWWDPAFESDTTQVKYNIGSDFDPDSAGSELQDSSATNFDHVLSLGQEVFYYIRGRHATSNGPWTDPVRSATVLERAPGIPSVTDVSLNYGAQQITLSWTAGSPNNADVYRIKSNRKSCVGNWEGWIAVAPPTDTASPYVHSAIVDGYSYKYKIQAENTHPTPLGYSSESATVNNYQTPSGPTWVSTFPKKNATNPDSAADLSWNVPVGTVDTYEIEYKLSSGSWTGTPQVTGIGTTTYTISPLLDNTSYDFRVRGSSTCTGDGSWGTTGTVITDRSLVETAPEWINVPYDDSSDDNSLKASWTPAFESDTTQVKYNLGSDFNPDSAGTQLQDSNATSFDHGGLSVGQQVFYYIRGRHATSDGPWTTPVRSATVLEGAPGVPSITNTSFNYGTMEVTLSWAAGTPNTADTYRIESNRGACGSGWEGWVAVAPPTDPASPYIHNVVERYSYKYHVRAENTGGNSDYSAEGATVVTAQSPNAPTNLVAVKGGDPTSEIDLTWVDPSTGTLDAIEIHRSATQGGSYSLVKTRNLGAQAWTDNVGDGETWWYKVRGTAGCGFSDGPFSNADGATTDSALPGAGPTDISVTPKQGTDQTVTINWTGVLDATNHDVYVSLSPNASSGGTPVGGSLEAGPIDVNVTSLLGATGDDQIYCNIRGTNSGGDGAWGSEASGYTHVSIPQGFHANLRMGDCPVINFDVSWDNDNSNSNSRSETMVLQRNDGGGYFTIDGGIPGGTVTYYDTGGSGSTTAYRLRYTSEGSYASDTNIFAECPE